MNKWKRSIAMKPHGSAVRHNMAAQIINPNPPRHRPDLWDATRPALSVEAYQKNEVKDPKPSGVDVKTTNADQ